VWALHGYQRSPCHHVVHRATVTQTRDGVDSGVLRGSSGGARDARHHTRPAEGSATLRTARSRRGQRAGALLARLPAWRRGCGCGWMEPLSLYRSTAPVLPACWKEVASASATSPKTSRAPWELWPLMSVHTRL
jgi:hypothetical protein